MKLAINALANPELKDDANSAILVMVLKLGDKYTEVRDLLSKVELNKASVEIVKAEYGAGSNQKDVTEIVKKHLNGTPLILLSSGKSVEAFGGDPVPGTAKQVKIEYKLNDLPGEGHTGRKHDHRAAGPEGKEMIFSGGLPQEIERRSGCGAT